MPKHKVECQACRRFLPKGSVTKCPTCKTRNVCIDCSTSWLGGGCSVCSARTIGKAIGSAIVATERKEPVVGYFVFVDEEDKPIKPGELKC